MTKLKDAINLLRAAIEAYDLGNDSEARGLINQAHMLCEASKPQCHQAAHLQRFMDSYERTSATAHLGEFRA